MTRYVPLERLAPEHDSSEFNCGSDAQTNWLRKHALQAQAAETAAVYVVCAASSRRVVAYFALVAGSVEPSDAPARVSKGTGRYPIPVILLARLGVDLSEQGHGLGKALIKEVLLRTSQAADTIGARALLVHAESDTARSFYQHLAEFEPSPTDALHLFLVMKDLRATIDGAGPASREDA